GALPIYTLVAGRPRVPGCLSRMRQCQACRASPDLFRPSRSDGLGPMVRATLRGLQVVVLGPETRSGLSCISLRGLLHTRGGERNDSGVGLRPDFVGAGPRLSQ